MRKGHTDEYRKQMHQIWTRLLALTEVLNQGFSSDRNDKATTKETRLYLDNRVFTIFASQTTISSHNADSIVILNPRRCGSSTSNLGRIPAATDARRLPIP